MAERKGSIEKEPVIYCKSGGCTAKLGAGILTHVLEKIPKGNKDPNLIVGYDSHDDAAVYRISDNLAVVQTLDFFPPMVEDPYIFGQIAAANALSDIYAMGGRVITALNIVCFPEEADLNILGRIMEGGALKVQEAGGTLAGGHSINDNDIKYGLSVTGLVNPNRVLTNNSAEPGDALVFTKRLGTGIICAAHRVGEATAQEMNQAVESMTTLNKRAAELSVKYDVHACTDVTGFGFLGHLHEMLAGDGEHKERTCVVETASIPVLPGALRYADEFLTTGGGQKNRNYAGPFVKFDRSVSFAMQEVLFDPQTSGGLLLSLPLDQAECLVKELQKEGLPGSIVGRVTGVKKDGEVGAGIFVK